MLIRIPKNLIDKVEFCSIEDRVARIIPGVTLSKTEMEEFEEFKDIFYRLVETALIGKNKLFINCKIKSNYILGHLDENIVFESYVRLIRISKKGVFKYVERQNYRL